MIAESVNFSFLSVTSHLQIMYVLHQLVQSCCSGCQVGAVLQHIEAGNLLPLPTAPVSVTSHLQIMYVLHQLVQSFCFPANNP